MGAVGGEIVGEGATAFGAGGVTQPLMGTKLKPEFKVNEDALTATTPEELNVTVDPSIIHAPEDFNVQLAVFKFNDVLAEKAEVCDLTFNC